MLRRILPFLVLLLFSADLWAQGTAPYQWTVTAKRLGDQHYELRFSSTGANGWQLYQPEQANIRDFAFAELKLGDSSVLPSSVTTQTPASSQFKSPLFDERMVAINNGPVEWRVELRFSGGVPAQLRGTLLYTYGRNDELYPGTEAPFTVALEGGVSAQNRILIPSIDINNPAAPCGDVSTADQNVWSVFFIGLGAGLLALLFPCIFPLIPLTVSFFTKRAPSRKRGIFNAFFYGFSIFLIYTLLSVPFHLFKPRPEVLNNISTNVPLNLVFFAIFIVFAISFFGAFEITLPSGLANKVDSKAGVSDIWGIFFMALTLTIVSFSCTAGILGALIGGSYNGPEAAWKLTAGMAGFGLGLGLPFVLFALFPGWLQSLPKSGGWMTELKVVFGFIELAMAIKFLSNADLVKGWHILPREVFIGLWVLIGAGIVLYLTGLLRFKGEGRRRFTPLRIGFIALFATLTLYLLPGVTNTRFANLTLISGFPPPRDYSIYPATKGGHKLAFEPMKNDYEGALARARAEGKPLLIDFTGWACVNCRRMEERVWTDKSVSERMQKEFVVVSLYVDERRRLPAAQQQEYTSRHGDKRSIETVGDKWATFQSENFFAVSQPQYAIISPDEKALTRTKSYTQDPQAFIDWLDCGLKAYRERQRP
ncbi:MAG: DUF255 domain-containing protein [Chitinophagaceae bacterium]|nr:MAG: DUF255 domain-containing protein [Chitinophagaceae bacterium]